MLRNTVWKLKMLVMVCTLRRISLVLPIFAATSWSGAVLAQGGPVAADAWKQIVAAAQQEGKVVIYGAMQAPVAQRLRSDFEKAYPGITVEYTRLQGGQMITKLNQEQQSGVDGGDIAITTEQAWLEEKAKTNALKRLVGPSSGIWPAAYMLAGTIPTLTLETMVITYNPAIVKSPITSYQDLFKPEFKGKITTEELVATVIVAWYDWVEKTQGANYFSRLAEQQPKFYTSSTGGMQSVAAGEFAIATVVNSGLVIPSMKQGLPVRIFSPSPAFGFAYLGAALGWSKRPNAAQLFMDYVMSVRGQTTWSGQGDSASPLPNIPGSLDAKSITPYDPNLYPPNVVKAYMAKWDSIFKK